MQLQLVAAALAALAARADGQEALDGIELVVECMASSADGFNSYRCGAQINRALTTSCKLQLASFQPPARLILSQGCRLWTTSIVQQAQRPLSLIFSCRNFSAINQGRVATPKTSTVRMLSAQHAQAGRRNLQRGGGERLHDVRRRSQWHFLPARVPGAAPAGPGGRD
jgi:hypothetical protein